jgi:glycosyltransferase involved in cell wall biosynthesis
MTQLIYIPIEPLTERYTEQWYRKFPKEFTAAGFKVTVVDGQPLIDDDIKVGTFLDINSTCHYKFSQLQLVAKMFQRGQVEQGAVFFFGDIEFWGLESVRLLAQMNNIDVYLTGFLHAASYTKEDAFAVAAPYQKYTEVGWIAALDKVFVGSEYHKQAFINRRLMDIPWAGPLADKIVVTKNPIFLDEYQQFDLPKRKRVVLTNRLDAEKRPQETLQLFEMAKQRFPDWEFVVTTSRKILRSNDDSIVEYARKLESEGLIQIKAGLTKEGYHRELSQAQIMVSHSIEENYGYCIAEALVYKVLPLLRNNASHPEFVGPGLLFSNHEEAWTSLCEIIEAIDDGLVYWQTPVLDTSGMQNIINELKLLK